MGTQLPHGKGTIAPTFAIYVRRLCLRPYNPRPVSVVSKRWIGLDILVREGHGPGDIVLDEDPVPLPRKGHSCPHFSARLYNFLCRNAAEFVCNHGLTQLADTPTRMEITY